MNYSTSLAKGSIDPIRSMAIELLEQAYLTDGISDREVPQLYHDNCRLIERRLYTHFRKEAQEQQLSNEKVRECYLRQLIRIALHLSQRTIPGYYDLEFNREMRESLDTVFGLKLPELDLKEYSFEERALTEAFYESLNEVESKFFRSDGELELSDDQADDLYSRSFNRLCFELRSKQRSTPDHLCIFTDVNLEEMPAGSERAALIKQTFCLDTRELLKHLRSDKVNPVTGLKISPETLKNLTEKYKEHL